MRESEVSEGFDLRPYLEQKRKLVDLELDARIPAASVHPGLLHEAMRYSVFAGGKRLRPILALATAEALQVEAKRVLTLCCSLELIHTYSLIHDDLPAMDDDDYRRGELTCHRKYGEAVAILAGNALMALAFELLSEEQEVNETVQVSVIRRLSAAVGSRGGLIAGQVVDLCTEGKAYTGEELDFIHSFKTGALIEAAVTCAARLCGGSEAMKCLRTYAISSGLAFQIVDDILDIEGSSVELGKTRGKDEAERKATYPALYGLEESRRRVAELIEGAVEVVEPLGPPARPLQEIARFIASRRY